MTSPLRHLDPSPSPEGAGAAVRGFVSALAAKALLEHTARLEVVLGGGGALETLIAVEQALGWAADAPARELIWATEAGALRLNAYDQDGRLLLKRVYGAPDHG
jgi:hypothetical protein